MKKKMRLNWINKHINEWAIEFNPFCHP